MAFCFGECGVGRRTADMSNSLESVPQNQSNMDSELAVGS